MSSTSLSSLLKIESHLAAAEAVLIQDLVQFPMLQRIHDLVSEALQCVTTERIRLRYGLNSGRDHKSPDT